MLIPWLIVERFSCLQRYQLRALFFYCLHVSDFLLPEYLVLISGRKINTAGFIVYLFCSEGGRSAASCFCLEVPKGWQSFTHIAYLMSVKRTRKKRAYAQTLLFSFVCKYISIFFLLLVL